MTTKKIWNALNDFEMLKNVKSLVLAVSGGVDSVSMLHFFVKNWNGNIVVAHVNHNLRGSESERDEKFVQNLCEFYKVKFCLGSFLISDLAKISKKGIEETAREKRYDFFYKISQENDALIATAHTLSDSIETILFNLSRGTGLPGLSGIPPKRGNIIRPLIYTTRTEIESYAKMNHLEYVTDSSNLSNLYSRNKIRNNIIPEIKKINNSFENNILRCLNQIREENEYLNSVSKQKFKETNLNCEKINLLPSAIKNRVLRLILSQFHDIIEYRHVQLANKMLNSQINSFNLSGNKKVKIKNGFIYCEHMQYNLVESSFSILEISKESLNYKFENFTNLFNLEHDVSCFKFRTRKEGDHFHLCKRNCTKSLKKLFNELKIPVYLRNKLKILEDTSCEEIVWIESIGVSENYQVKSSSLKIGKIISLQI